MIIDNFNILRATLCPHETYSILVVDADTVLALPVAA